MTNTENMEIRKKLQNSYNYPFKDIMISQSFSSPLSL